LEAFSSFNLHIARHHSKVLILFFTLLVLAPLSFTLVQLETFVNSTLLISMKIIESGYVPSRIEGPSWFGHADTLKEYPASMVLLAIFSEITNLDVEFVIRLPILLPLVVLLIYILTTRLTRSRSMLSFLLTFVSFIAFFVVNTLNLYTITYHSLGYIEIFLFLFIVYKLLMDSRKDSGTYILLFIIVLIAPLTYYFASTFILFYCTASIALMLIAKLLVILFGKHRYHINNQLNDASIIFFSMSAVVLVSELLFPRIIAGLHINLESLMDILLGLTAESYVKPYEQTIYINEAAKQIIESRTRVLFLSDISKYYFYHFNLMLGILSILLLLFITYTGRAKDLNTLAFMHTALFTGSAIHALVYYVTYGALGTRAYQFVYVPLAPAITLTYIEKLPKIRWQRVLSAILCCIVLISVTLAIRGDLMIGFIEGCTRSSNLRYSIKTLDECILLSRLVDNQVSILTDYPRSQYIFRGFILNNKTGTVIPYVNKIKYVYTIFDDSDQYINSNEILLQNYAILIALDNFIRPVFGDIAAYVSPPFNMAKFLKQVNDANLLYQSNSLWLIELKQ